jgi:hypothetical protein
MNGGDVIGRGIQRMAGFVKHNISLRLALVRLNIKRFLVLCTIQVLSIKVELIIVLHKLGQLGQRLQTTAHKIHRLVLQALKEGN